MPESQIQSSLEKIFYSKEHIERKWGLNTEDLILLYTLTLLYLLTAYLAESYFKLVLYQNAGLQRNTLETDFFFLEYF